MRSIHSGIAGTAVVAAVVGGALVLKASGGPGGGIELRAADGGFEASVDSTVPEPAAKEDPADSAEAPPPEEAPAPPPTEPPADGSDTAGIGDGTTAAGRRGWPLVAADEFDGPSVDPNRWLLYDSVGNGGVGWRRPSAISQSGGTLEITGRGDVSGGMSWREGRTYGRWEVRARIDRGNGYGPAILLWPSSNRFPEDGEIDISEIPLGDRTRSHFTVHWGAENNQTGFEVTGDFTQWHNFAVEWLPDRIAFFLDGEELYSLTDPVAIPHWDMNLALQNDVGPFGQWIPRRDASTPAEVRLEVDWVRIYSAG